MEIAHGRTGPLVEAYRDRCDWVNDRTAFGPEKANGIHHLSDALDRIRVHDSARNLVVIIDLSDLGHFGILLLPSGLVAVADHVAMAVEADDIWCRIHSHLLAEAEECRCIAGV